MLDQFKIAVGSQCESGAMLRVDSRPGQQILTITGELTGPQCEYARTLPCSFPVIGEYGDGWFGESPRSGTSLVIDPCYWTPALPFLYELRLGVQALSGNLNRLNTQVGLKRWEVQQKNFLLESKRYVLRGAEGDQLTKSALQSARAAETALLVNRFDQEFLTNADRLGVIVIADLRTSDGPGSLDLLKLDWFPSVFLVLLNPEQIANQARFDTLPRHCHIATCLSAESDLEHPDESSSDVIAFELKSGERPPSWITSIKKPVIAIRRGVDYSDLQSARAACDRLQAELAPEFDLAGYFVAP